MGLLHPAPVILLAACSLVAGPAFAGPDAEGDRRWYSAADVARGRDIFAAHCAVCHGARAQGATVGSLTAPPLDGGGHSAHHGLDYLLEQVTNGGASRGGKMPAFGPVLNNSDRRAAIAWVQNLWPEATYRHWRQLHPGSHHQALLDNPFPTG